MLEKIHLRRFVVRGYISFHEFTQYLRCRYVLRLAGVDETFVQFWIDANPQCGCFGHCVANGYTTFEEISIRIKISRVNRGQATLCAVCQSDLLPQRHPAGRALQVLPGAEPVVRRSRYPELLRSHPEPGMVDEIRSATNGNHLLGTERM